VGLAQAGQVQPAAMEQAPSFKQVDADHDGSINRHEAFEAGVMDKAQFKAADKDGNGKLDKREFREAMAGNRPRTGMAPRQGS